MTTKIDDVCTCVGVPDITPVEVLIDKPADNGGVIENDLVPVISVAVKAVVDVIAMPTFPDTAWEAGVTETTVTDATTTVITTDAEAEDTPSDAVTVYVATDFETTGVPEITPVEVFIDKPADNGGVIENDLVPVISVAVKAVVDVIAVPTFPFTDCEVGVIEAAAATGATPKLPAAIVVTKSESKTVITFFLK